MGNLYIPAKVIYEDDERRIIGVTTTDLERNVTWPIEITVAKTVERKSPEAGREILRMRTKKDGNVVYVLSATEEELTGKQNALISKAARTGVERLARPDVLAECLE